MWVFAMFFSLAVATNVCGSVRDPSDFSSISTMEANGWEFGWEDSSTGGWSSSFCSGFDAGDYYCGWCSGECVGEVTLTLDLSGYESGWLEITYGNNYDYGVDQVTVLLNDILLDTANSVSQTFGVAFHDGDVLKVKEEHGVMIISGIEFNCSPAPTIMPSLAPTIMPSLAPTAGPITSVVAADFLLDALKAEIMNEMMQEVDRQNAVIAALKVEMSVVKTEMLQDVAWQALHAAAAAACRGSTALGGAGVDPNAVIPKFNNDTCDNMCAATDLPICTADVSIKGIYGKAMDYNTPVGHFYNYGCDSVENSNVLYDEVQAEEGDIIADTNNYYRFCCCRAFASF